MNIQKAPALIQTQNADDISHQDFGNHMTLHLYLPLSRSMIFYSKSVPQILYHLFNQWSAFMNSKYTIKFIKTPSDATINSFHCQRIFRNLLGSNGFVITDLSSYPFSRIKYNLTTENAGSGIFSAHSSVDTQAQIFEIYLT